jgi:hypothetical protein
MAYSDSEPPRGKQGTDSMTSGSAGSAGCAAHQGVLRKPVVGFCAIGAVPLDRDLKVGPGENLYDRHPWGHPTPR